uniref:Uncharacterized protein LOC105109968 isoform X1 n=1 Tax=Rhizophora mucronata TaxID=61149 RepID=A0A2P2QI57_RHIMU
MIKHLGVSNYSFHHYQLTAERILGFQMSQIHFLNQNVVIDPFIIVKA